MIHNTEPDKVRAFMFPSKSDKKKKRRRGGGHKKLAAVITVVVLLAAGIAAYLVFFQNDSDGLNGVKLRIPNNAEIIPVNEAIYYLHDQTLACVDYNDNEKWKVQLGGSDLSISASNDIIAVYNSNTLWLYGFDGVELLSAPITFPGIIKNVRCGVAATMVLYQDNENTMVVDTISKAGERGKSYSAKDRFVMDFGLIDNDSSYIYTMDMGSVTTVSRVFARNDQQADIGNISVIGQALQHVIFRNEGIYTVGSQQITLYNYVGEEQTSHLIFGWKYIDSILTEQNETYILMAPGGETAMGIYIPTARLHTPKKPDISIQLNAGTKQLFLGESKIYTFTSDKMIAYSFDGEKHGEFTAKYDDTEIDRVLKAPYISKTNRALICTADAVYSVKLP